MFWKIVTVIFATALCGAWLLALRQERTQTLSEMTQAQLRINRQDQHLWMLRTKIAQRITPPQVEKMTAGLIDLHPIAPYNALTADQVAEMSGDSWGTDGPPLPPGIAKREQLEERPLLNTKSKSSKPADGKADGKAGGKPSSKPATKSSKSGAPTRVAKGDVQENQ